MYYYRINKRRKKMGKINKIIVAAALLAIVFGGISVAQACACPRITCIDVSYDMVSYTGYVELENTGDENVSVVVVIYVDNNRTLEREVTLNIEYFKGFRLRTLETVEFEAPCEEGNHEVHVTVIVDNMSLLGNVSYIAQGCIKEEEEEEEEINEGDWLGCP
jgi:hypothetical protein